MIKKIFTPVNSVFLLWGLVALVVFQMYPGYWVDFFHYSQVLFVPLLIPVGIYYFIKQAKNDKRNRTAAFKSSIFVMLLIVVILVVFYFVTKQNPI